MKKSEIRNPKSETITNSKLEHSNFEFVSCFDIRISNFLIFLFIFTVLWVKSFAQACPLCKDAIAKMGEIATSLGFNWSIGLMLLVPFALIGGFGSFLYWNYRKVQARQ